MVQKFVIFRMSEQKFAANVIEIQSIEHVTVFRPIPQVEHYFIGIIDLRGEIVPVIDLKLKLNMGITHITNTTNVIISRINDLLIGFLVDETTDVVDINVNSLKGPTELTGESKHIIEGVIKFNGMLILLIQFANVLDEEDLKIIRKLLTVKQ